ncbi:cilia- and flagella-associated protein 100 [Amazona ochrocephala]
MPYASADKEMSQQQNCVNSLIPHWTQLATSVDERVTLTMVYLFCVSELITITPFPLGTTAKATKRDKIQGNQNLTACQPNIKHDRAPCSMSVQSNSWSTSLQETHSDEAVPESPEKDEEKTKKNPFAVPPDFDIFSIRDKERQKAWEVHICALGQCICKQFTRVGNQPNMTPNQYNTKIYLIHTQTVQIAKNCTSARVKALSMNNLLPSRKLWGITQEGKMRTERERMKTMKIHEKTTYSTKVKAKPKELRQALQQEEKEEARKQATNEERLKSLLWKTARKKDYPVKKETFRDYIDGRREIFLLKGSFQYGMKVQREEIERLEEIAKNEERKVEEAEQDLKKRAAAFEEFLKENKKNSVQALKSAGKEAEEKTKKIEEIREVTSQIENLQSDINRLKRELKEYKMYRNFLHQVSLKKWQREHSKRYTSTGDVKTAPSTTEDASSPTTAEQGQGGTARTDAASPSSTNNMDVPSFLLSSKTLTAKSLRDIKPQLINFLKPLSTKMTVLEDAGTETSSDEDELLVSQWKTKTRKAEVHHMCFPLQDPELYFTDPQQLLSIFTEMEDENLSLLQKCQEAEGSLKRVQQTFITTHERMEKETAELKEQVAALKSSIAEEEERAADLKLKVQLLSSGEDDQDNILASLSKKVQEFYCQCTGESGGNLQTAEMLMVLEKQLYDLLDNLDEKTEHAMKLKEKERRMKLKEEKLRQKEQQREEKLKKALERSKAAVEVKVSTGIHGNPSPNSPLQGSWGYLNIKDFREEDYTLGVAPLRCSPVYRADVT